MDSLPPPEEASEFLAAPQTRLEVEKLLRRGAIEGGFILHGPDGAGKATLAYLLAATVLSGGRALGETEPKVRSLIAANAHPDLKTLRRTENEKTGKLRSEIDVEAARGIIGRLHQTSTTGRSVIVVDLADELGRSASNSLLKILEEPPRGAALFLLSRSPSRLLPTLVSRCRKIALRPVAEEPLGAWLAGRAGIAPPDALDIARQSGGAPGRALRLAAGEGQDAVTVADNFFKAATGRGDLLAAARKFSGKDAELIAEEAQELVLARLRRTLRENADDSTALARHLLAYDRAVSIFTEAGTADRTQTAYLAGLSIQEALAGA